MRTPDSHGRQWNDSECLVKVTAYPDDCCGPFRGPTYTQSMLQDTLDSLVDMLSAWTTKRYGADRSPPLNCTWHDETAFIGEMSMDNLFHAFIHSVPTYEYYARLRQTFDRSVSGSHHRHIVVLPHFLVLQIEQGSRIRRMAASCNELGLDSAMWKLAEPRMRAPPAWRLATAIGGSMAAMDHSCRRRLPQNESVMRVARFATRLPPALLHVYLTRIGRFSSSFAGHTVIVNMRAFRTTLKPIQAGQCGAIRTAEDLPVMEQYALVQASTSLAACTVWATWTMPLSDAAVARLASRSHVAKPSTS